MIRARFALLTPAIFALLGCASNGSGHAEETERTAPATGRACDGRQLDGGLPAYVVRPLSDQLECGRQ